MATSGSPDAEENHVHILAEAADESHEAQVFRMHRDKRIKALARAYAVFRNVPGEDGRFRLSTAQHGDLDLMASAGSYGFSNGEVVIFTEVEQSAVVAEASGDKELQQPAQQPENTEVVTGHRGREPEQQRPVVPRPKSKSQRLQRQGKNDSGRFRQSNSVAASKAKAVAKTKAKPKASAKKRGIAKKVDAGSGEWARASFYSLPENMSAKPDVPADMCKSTIVESGPAKDWSVTAWLKEQRSKKEEGVHNKVISWRISSPGRSRTFDTFSSSRGTPNLKDAVDEAVFTQITTDVKPELAKQIREKKSSLESNRQTASSSVTPQKRAAKDGKNAAKKESGPVKREVATPARVPRQQAKRARVDASNVAEAANSKVSACGYVAFLKRQPTCTPPGELQPPLVHVQDYMRIGRADTCDLVIDSKQSPQMISRCHALLQREDGVFTLTDQKSTNGITVNGQRIDAKITLANGDKITFGVPCAQPELDYIFELKPGKQ